MRRTQAAEDGDKKGWGLVDDLPAAHGVKFVLKAPRSASATFRRDGITRSIENLGNNAVKYGNPHAPIPITIQQAGEQHPTDLAADTGSADVANRIAGGQSLDARSGRKLKL